MRARASTCRTAEARQASWWWSRSRRVACCRCPTTYAGNNALNTLGTLQRHPLAGLLFWFDGGRAFLSVSCRAELVWDGPEVERLPGARRAVPLHVLGVEP